MQASPKVGLANLHYAKMVQDNLTTGVIYEAPKKIAGLVTAERKAAADTATLYADNGPSDTATTLGEITLDLETKDIPIEIQADLLGHSIVNGIMVSHSNDAAPYVAILFEGLKANGKKRYKKLLKGKFQEPDDTYKTKGDKIEYQTQKITGKFVIRDYDGLWEYTADEDMDDYVASIGDNWYASVEPTGDTTPPTVACNIVDAATGVAVSTDIVFTFNESIQASTATSNNILVMKADGTAVAGTISLDTDHKVVTFKPSSNLAASSAYIAIVTTNVKDLAGNALAAPFFVNFTTA